MALPTRQISRPACRLILRSASTSKSQPLRKTAKSASLIPQKKPTATNAPKPSSDPRFPALRSAWPWRPASSHYPPPPEGFAEEERVIYARPYEGPLGSRVKMFWFVFPFGGLIIGMYVSTPKLKRRGDEGEEDKVRGEVSANDWVPEDKPWYWRLDNLAVIAVTSAFCVMWTFAPTRFITRLSLIKRYPTSPSPSAPGKVTEFLRMQHGGHLMALSEKAPVRDLAVSDVAITAIGRAGATSYLNVKVTPGGQKKRFSLDAIGYRLDFRDTKLIKHTDQEVVLSLNRIEHVFGALR